MFAFAVHFCLSMDFDVIHHYLSSYTYHLWIVFLRLTDGKWCKMSDDLDKLLIEEDYYTFLNVSKVVSIHHCLFILRFRLFLKNEISMH